MNSSRESYLGGKKRAMKKKRLVWVTIQHAAKFRLVMSAFQIGTRYTVLHVLSTRLLSRVLYEHVLSTYTTGSCTAFTLCLPYWVLHCMYSAT